MSTDAGVPAVDPASTALVLIDLQERIVALPTAPLDGPSVVAAATDLLAAFRAAGGHVVLVNVVRPGEPVDPPAPGDRFVPGIEPQPEDIVITKHTWNAFHETGLNEKLRERGIDTLVIAGIATNFGVESTARTADDHGYRLLLPADAMAGLDASAHEFAVGTIFPLIGQVCGRADILAGLARNPA
ncbi:MAG TPA: isochorismatase family protein [Pseudonocardiaceae bacterium]